MLHDACISDLCLGFKDPSLKLVKNTDPAQISDIRLLAMNDMYKFEREFTSSASKYFSTNIYTILKPTLSFNAYLPTGGLDCYDWCMNIKVSPPVDWITAMTLFSDSKNHLCCGRKVNVKRKRHIIQMANHCVRMISYYICLIFTMNTHFECIFFIQYFINKIHQLH
jgi:hypothetical protein